MGNIYCCWLIYMENYNQPPQVEKSESVKYLYKGTRIVWFLLLFLEVLLVFRFLLKLFAANPLAGFTQFVYGVTSIFVAPFQAVFSVSQVKGSVFEWTTILSMGVYFLIAWAIIKLIIISKPVSRNEASEKLNIQDR